MMIMLRSTRLCVYNKVLVPFEASFFFVFGAKTKTKFFFFSPACILGCHHRSVGLIFFSLGRFFLTLSLHKNQRVKRNSFAFRARAKGQHEGELQRISSRDQSLLIVAHRTRSARVSRARGEK
jgi:hypothetical protein